MKPGLVIILFLISSIGLAQFKWSYELYYSFDGLSGDNYIGNSNLASFNIQYTEFNYTTGINLKRQISKKLSVLTGLNYSNQEVSRSFVCPVCDVAGDVLPIVNKQRYLQIPFGISYQAISKRFSPVFETGLLNNFLVASDVDDIVGNESPGNYYLSGFIGTRLHYQIFAKIGINIGYRFSKSFTDVFESDFDYLSNNFTIGVSYML